MANFPLPKGYQRLSKFPIDETEIFTSDASARAYAISPSAYPGQKISVVNDSTNEVDVYVILPDGSLGAIGGSTTNLTADNGLTITDNDIKFGGILSTDTTLDISTYVFTVRSTLTSTYTDFGEDYYETYAFNAAGNDYGYVEIYPTYVDIYSEVGNGLGKSSNIQLSGGGIAIDASAIIVSNSLSPIFAGIQYADNYAINFTNRSLVDKQYVDTKAAASVIAWNGLTKTVDGSIGLGGTLAQDSNIITGNKILSITGNLAVTGNLTVDGSITTVNSVNLDVSDNIITINSGETGSGVSKGYAGLLVDRGTSDPYVFVFEESSDTFRIGIGTESGLPVGTQAVATRQDTPISAGISYWNTSQNRLDTVSGFTYDASGLGLSTVVASTTESTALFFDGEHVVSRELGTNAFSSTVFATDASITALTNRLNTTDASVALLQTKDTQIDASIVRIDASIASLVTKGASVYKGTFDGTAGTTTTITAATHELGVGPLSISVYDGVEQVYTDVECAANGDITLTWGAGTLTASCKYVIIG